MVKYYISDDGTALWAKDDYTSYPVYRNGRWLKDIGDIESGTTAFTSESGVTIPEYPYRTHLGIATSGGTISEVGIAYTEQPTQKGGIEMFDSLTTTGYISLIPLVLFVIYLLTHAGYSTWLWIDDKKQRALLGDDKDGIGWDICATAVMAMGVFLGIIFWKFIVPIGFLFAIAFGLRWVIRFKKKVNKLVAKCTPKPKKKAKK